MTAHRILSLEWCGSTLVIAPQCDVSALEEETIRSELKDILQVLEDSPAESLIIDLKCCPHFGSTMLGALIKLWRRMLRLQGRMALCHVSEFECEVLKVTKLDGVWPIYGTRAEALAELRT